ncbi:hypothetical protein [Pseudidiomarina taiwanensis]|uniref:hypothetical protein n=1 Tax=Pseudidiomarina taiwanensis TaxID=337250 RepID=UPI000F896DF2|nr:hypothetical protein [Pseudidiomarina taiwanensis]
MRGRRWRIYQPRSWWQVQPCCWAIDTEQGALCELTTGQEWQLTADIFCTPVGSCFRIIGQHGSRWLWFSERRSGARAYRRLVRWLQYCRAQRLR